MKSELEELKKEVAALKEGAIEKRDANIEKRYLSQCRICMEPYVGYVCSY